MRIRALFAAPLLTPIAFATLAALVANPGDAEPPVTMPRPQPFALRVDAAATNATCESCHADIASEWRASYHGQADTDPVYRRALAREPLPFCRGCHAPEADARAPAPPAISAIGVGCVTCHQTEANGNVLAAPLRGANAGAASKAPHGVTRDPRFATASACANCHEFAFPRVASSHTSDPMQSTITEHAASPRAETACATCHMPVIQGSGTDRPHRSHAFLGGRDPALVKSSLSVSATRTSDSHVAITLTPGDVGHAVPTGDLFRRLVVSAEVIGDDWNVISEDERDLSRKFVVREIAPGKTGRVLVGDDRISAGRASTMDLEVGDSAVARARTIAWRVEYQIVEHPIGATDGASPDRPQDAVVSSSIVIAEGTLSPRATGIVPPSGKASP